jgi:hypothetical protein
MLRIGAVNNLEYLLNIYSEDELKNRVIKIDKYKIVPEKKAWGGKDPVLMNIKKFM